MDRHGRFAAVFVALAELLQGVGDDAPTAEPPFLALTTAAAAVLRRSWDSDFGDLPPPDTAAFAAARAVAPQRVTAKTAEGYAFYALYPEAYREAARPLDPETRVVGVRSIGAGLACVVAEAVGAAPPATVRPTGHPFARTATLPAVEATARYAVVDEGPGLSGSSFGAVADALEAKGVAPEHITFLPGHGGDLGPQASASHKARWAAATRLHDSFDALIAPRLSGWVEDLTGRRQSVHDLSGGAWRAFTHGEDEANWPPSAAHQERRKFLVRAEGGDFLLKFVGLGDGGLTAFDRARALHQAGFGAETLGWRHGFIVQRWVESRPVSAGERPLLAETLRRYLAYRREAFATAERGAEAAALAEMARVNVGEGLGADWAERVPAAPARSEAVVAGDGRLHAWEWRVRADGCLLKTDGVDHAFAHDLIGPQPPAWDEAGALVEHGLEPAEALDPFWPAAYAAFQLGLWRQAAEALAGWPEEAARCARQSETYADALRRLLG